MLYDTDSKMQSGIR